MLTENVMSEFITEADNKNKSANLSEKKFVWKTVNGELLTSNKSRIDEASALSLLPSEIDKKFIENKSLITVFEQYKMISTLPALRINVGGRSARISIDSV